MNGWWELVTTVIRLQIDSVSNSRSSDVVLSCYDTPGA